jgi:hypothetical protein
VKLLNWIRAYKAFRFTTVALASLATVVAVAIVVSVTINLGPLAKPYAEKFGSRYFDRGVHLGSLDIHLFAGKVRVRDFVIDGLHPGDRPFFSARQLSVDMDWTPVFAWKPDVTIARVDLTDWTMLVEKWPNAHSFPRVTRKDEGSGGPRRFTVTMKAFHGARGQFSYEDHEAPWAIFCRDITLDITNKPDYHGTATFTDGSVAIQDYVPMWTRMNAKFAIDGPRIQLRRIDLESDGASTVARGAVDLAHWPEQKYDVDSRVQFQRMREIFFKDESWPLTGEGAFTGTFHLFKDGRDLAGSFTSAELGVYTYRFPQLAGSLHWTPKAFEVADGRARFQGGDARFSYSVKPLGARTRPTARFDFDVAGMDLRQLTDFEQLAGQRFAGSAVWHNELEWTLGRFREHKGSGRIMVNAPSGTSVLTPAAVEEIRADTGHAQDEWGPFAPVPLSSHLPIAGEVTYRFGAEDVSFEGGRFATEKTHVSFEGSTAYGERSHIAFRVLSADWQESDQLLAGIMTDFGSRTGPVAFGGRGQFDGLMTGAFRRPRVEGDFAGERLRGFDAVWGDANGHVVVENSYVAVKDAVVRNGDSEIRVDGLFSLGYPRDDGDEEIDARFRVVRRDIDSLRHVFQIDDYPVSGRLSGEFHLTGQYEHPLGFGGMTVEDGVAYAEPFEKATATLGFDGTGVRLDGIQIAKGTGNVTGAAYVGWDSTYSFDVSGRRVPMDQIAFVQYPGAQVTGTAEFTAAGSGTFDIPRNDIRFRIADLSAGGEPVGQVTGTLAMRGTELSGEIGAASARLAVTGTGRIALTPQRDAEITFRFHDTSLDPYVRLFEPRLSPFTTAVISGSVRVIGELAHADRVVVDSTVDTVDIRLFDYAIRNAAPVRLSSDRGTIKVQDLRLVGDDTELRISGGVNLNDSRIGVQVSGEANLGILQGFFRDVRGSGRMTMTAGIDGPLKEPVFSGDATIADGRIRHFSLPNALDEINGTLHFDSGGIRLDDVTAAFGGGRVQFGGRIGFTGYMPGELNVTARGENMNMRVPEGVRSVVDANLSLTGNYLAPTLGGTVTVKNAVWSRRADTPGSIFDLASRRSGASVAAPEPAPAFPLKFDLQLLVPSTLRVENNMARMVANAELTLRGTYDKPVLFGHADIERGEVIFEGRRYRITRGTMDFTNPNRIEPFFDVEAETNVRVPGQTYRVIIALAGTTEQLRPNVSSDPPLPTADVLALLFSEVAASARGTGQTLAPEVRARLDPTQTQTDIVTARATQALTTPISAEVGRVVEQTFGVSTFQLTPSFIDPYSTQNGRINPTARVTVGKRISDRVYITFSRSLNTTTNDQIVLLEIDQSDRVSWVLSRNEDAQTYTLEFRVRRVF